MVWFVFICVVVNFDDFVISLKVREVIVLGFEGFEDFSDLSFPILLVPLALLPLPLLPLFLPWIRSSRIDKAYGERAGGHRTLSRSSISYLIVSDLLLTLVSEVLFDAEDGRYFDIKGITCDVPISVAAHPVVL